MATHASTSIWIHLGGTGARQQPRRDLRVAFDFDGMDHLVGYGAYAAAVVGGGHRRVAVRGPDDPAPAGAVIDAPAVEAQLAIAGSRQVSRGRARY